MIGLGLCVLDADHMVRADVGKRPQAALNAQMVRTRCSRYLLSVCGYYGVSPYMASSWPWAKARAGRISIWPPMISI